MTVPEKPSLDGLEAKWGERWEADGTYRFDRSKTREQIFAIDTPPPTASGSLHVGHVMSYTHTDLVARYQRMRGRRGLLPDGVGRQRAADRASGAELLRRPVRSVAARTTRRSTLATLERPEDAARRREPRRTSSSSASGSPPRTRRPSSSCSGRLGLSVDWTQTYTTIGEVVAAGLAAGVPAAGERGHAYTAEAPTMWDVDFRTAVAQAEIEDREIDGVYHRIAFDREDGGGRVEIETSRPELIPACVALVVNPDDERYASLVGLDRAHAAVPRAGAGRRARAGRPREGDRRRADLHVRRRDRRHVVARAGLPRAS